MIMVKKTLTIVVLGMFAFMLSCCTDGGSEEKNDGVLSEEDSFENESFDFCWMETETKQDIYNKLNLAIRAVDQDTSYHLADDLSLLETTEPVYAYCLIDDKFEMVTIYYPIIYKGHVVAMADGYRYLEGNFDIDVILGEAVDELDNKNISILFANGVYAYDGEKITFLYYSLEYDENNINCLDSEKEYDLSNIHVTNMTHTELLNYPF